MISALIHQTLGPLVHGRCYPNTFAQPNGGPPTWPAIRYTLISSNPAADICGTAGTNLDDTRVQLDVVAKTYGAAAVLRDQVVAAMQSLSPPCIRDGGFETFDDETKTHRVVMDFVFYPSSALTGSPP